MGQEQEPVVLGHMHHQIGSHDPAAEFTYNTNSRGKRKKKSRDDDPYANVDYSKSMSPPKLPRADSVPSFLEEVVPIKHSPQHVYGQPLPPISKPPNKDIKLQSNLLGNNRNDFAIDEENDVAMDNKISVEETQYGNAYENEFAYGDGNDFDES